APAGLQEDAGDVRFHRRLADERLGGDLGVRQSAGYEAQDVGLAGGQPVEPGRGAVRRGRRSLDERLDQPTGDNRGQQRLTVGDGVDGGDELLGWYVLQHEAAGTGAQCLVHVVVQVEGGQDEHVRVVLAA